MKLFLHNKEVDSIYDLLSNVKKDENSLTYGLGWVFTESESFFKDFMSELEIKNNLNNYNIKLQEYKDKKIGYTDIELDGLEKEDYYLIVEAKIGWNIPTKNQINNYCKRFKEYRKNNCIIVILSECSEEYAENILKSYNIKYKWYYLPWSKIYQKLDKRILKTRGSHEKKSLKEFHLFLNKMITMQNKKSNEVFCVSLSRDSARGSDTTFVDVVEKYQKYFFPIEKGWPSEPPNYVAFRYDGELQSIHHVDSYIKTTKLYEHLPFPREEEDGPRFLLTLSKPFKPSKTIKNGAKWRSNHVWFDLDTIFLCDTIKEAIDLTKKRER